MSTFVDTGVFYANQVENSPRHAEATAALRSLLSGSRGRVYTSDYVFDETITLTQSRTGRGDEARSVGERIRGRGSHPDAITMVFVDREVFETAIDIHERYDDHSLSFTDATTVALVQSYGIDAVCSFDDDFDGIVQRVDPGQLAD